MTGKNKENQSRGGNTTSCNTRTVWYRNESNGAGADANTPKLTREIKFHMHDASQRNTKKSFERKEEKIVSEIKIELDQSKYIVTSIEADLVKVFSEPTLWESTGDATINSRLKSFQNR